MSAKETTAIQLMQPESLGLPRKPQTDPEMVTDCLRFAAQHAIVLAPVSQITFIPPGHQIEFMVCSFTTDGVDTYESQNGAVLASRNSGNALWYAVSGGKLALHKGPLEMLARAVGVSWDTFERRDDGSSPYYWDYAARMRIKGMDGVERPWSRSATYDLRGNKDGMSAAAHKAAGDKGVTGVPLREARIHGGRRCETMAALATVRAALGIRAYTWAEAQQPFVLPLVRFVPDMSDPAIKAMVTAKELGIITEMNGPDPRAADPAAKASPPPLAVVPNTGARQLPEPDPIPQDDIPTKARETAPVEKPEPRDEAPAQTKPRRSNRPPCGPCGLPLSEIQAKRTADLDGGPYCQDCQPRV